MGLHLLAESCSNSDFIPNWPTAIVTLGLLAAGAFVFWVLAR